MSITARSVILVSLFLCVSAEFDPDVVNFVRGVLGDKLSDADDLGSAIGKLLGSGWADRTKKTYEEEVIPHVDRSIDLLPNLRTILDKYGLVPGKEGVPPSYQVDIRLYPAEIRDFISDVAMEELMSQIVVE